jgi:hypothetical protein
MTPTPAAAEAMLQLRNLFELGFDASEAGV